jgi:Domain of unknown function DUF29
MNRSRAAKSEAEQEQPDAAGYGADFYSWAFHQANLLRAGRLSEIDSENIAEELTGLGNEQYDKLESALAVLLMHLLKWDHQPDRRSRSWQNSIREQRRRVDRLLRKNPGLKPHRDEAVGEAYLDARDRASTEIDKDIDQFPGHCPYPWEDIMSREIEYATAPRRRR